MQESNIITRVRRSTSTGSTGRVSNCGKEMELTGIPLLRLTYRGRCGGREWGRKRGRKREDILRGKAVIYEQATSNKQGEGDTPPPIKHGGGRRRRRKESERFKEGVTVEKSKVHL